jgi:hypothetical protein
MTDKEKLELFLHRFIDLTALCLPSCEGDEEKQRADEWAKEIFFLHQKWVRQVRSLE